MPRLFDGLVSVDYGQFYLLHGDPNTEIDLPEAFRGQNNGLCGAVIPDLLFLTTATHTGDVALTIDIHPSSPSLDEEWEECVEVSFKAVGEQLTLMEWLGGTVDIPLESGTYRVRYSARGMDQGGDADILERGIAADDRYRLDFWPAAKAIDAIIRQTSEEAARWHQWVKRPNQDVA